jgi:lauroyl/myristoyl acyltransferase
MEVLAHRGGEQPPFETLVQRLSGSGRVVCLLADRDLSTSGVDVEFCGGRISMAAGPAALALRTGAPLLPVTLWFTESGWGGVVHPAIPATDVTGMTQGLADVFAASIREHPQDWHMLGKVFTG